MTRLEDEQVPDAVYDIASQQFSEAELAQLTGHCRNQWLEPFQCGVPDTSWDYKSTMMRKTR